MASEATIARELLGFLQEELRLLGYEDPVTLETELISSGLIDSVLIVQLLTFITDHFCVECRLRDVAGKDLNTIGDFAQFIAARKQDRAAPTGGPSALMS